MFNQQSYPMRSPEMTTDEVFPVTMAKTAVEEFRQVAARVHAAKLANPNLDNMSPLFYTRVGARVISDEEQVNREKYGYKVYGYTTIDGVRYFLGNPTDPTKHPALNKGVSQKEAA